MDFDAAMRFRLKRVNPFQGLVIDSDTWRDAHDYHRDQQRLHLLAFHGTGIIGGLQVKANEPADLSISIKPGLAVDPEGNIIIVPDAQHYKIQTREKGIIYLIIQFREVPGEPYQPSEGGQPTRILEAYRIQERDQLPKEPYLELARIDFNPADAVIKDASRADQPGKNQIDLRHRQEAVQAPPPVPPGPAAAPEKAAAPRREPPVQSPEAFLIGHAVLGEAARDQHIRGLRNLVRGLNGLSGSNIGLEENVKLGKINGRFGLVYLTGSSDFSLAPDEQSALAGFLDSGGVILGEGCDGQKQGGAKEFGLAFNKVASSLDCKLEVIQRDHPLLSAHHIFTEIPPGAGPAMLLEGGRMMYSGCDYGCAWSGGHEDSPLPREIIRSAVEMGENIIAYSHMAKL